MANKIKDSVTLSYELYCAETEDPISKKEYVKINRDFMKYISSRLLVDGSVKLPERLGSVQILGRKSKFRVEDGLIKGLAPDWKATKDLWAAEPEAKEQKRVLFHFNEETNGIRYRFFWSKHGVIVPNKTLYDFKVCRTNKRLLATMIRSGHEYMIK